MSEAAEARILKENVNEGAEQAPGSDGLAAVQNEQEHDETGGDAGETAGDGAAKPLMDTLKLSALDLDKDKFNLRADLEDDTFADSIRDNGQLVAIAVRRIPDSERFEVLDGWRRVTALKKLDKEQVLAVVHDDLDDDAAYRFVLDVNLNQESYGGVDLINAALRMQRDGKTVDEVAELCGVSKRTAEHRLSAAKLTDEIKAKLDSEEHLHVHHLAAIAAAARRDKNIDVEDWVKKCVSKKLSVRALRESLAEESADRRSERRKATLPSLFNEGKSQFDKGIVYFGSRECHLDACADDDKKRMRAQAETLLKYLEG